MSLSDNFSVVAVYQMVILLHSALATGVSNHAMHGHTPAVEMLYIRQAIMPLSTLTCIQERQHICIATLGQGGQG